MEGIFFVMSRRTLSESGIAAPVEEVGIGVFCSISSKTGLSESIFRVKGTCRNLTLEEKGPVGIMPSMGGWGGGVRIKDRMSHYII